MFGATWETSFALVEDKLMFTILVASCDDGNKNQDETGVDCGGSICTQRCDLNQVCSNNSDCSNGNCYIAVNICQ
ncbi:unnamed protein product, partial [Adineta ricciae]